MNEKLLHQTMNTFEQPYYVTMILWSSKLCRPSSFIQRYEMSDPAFVRRSLVIFRIVWTTYHKRHPEEVQVFVHVRPLMSQYAISHLPEEATWSGICWPNLSKLLHLMNLSYTLHVHGFLLVYCQIAALNQRLVANFKRVNWPLFMVNLLSLIFYLVSLSYSSTDKRLKTSEFIDCVITRIYFSKNYVVTAVDFYIYVWL